MARVRPRSSRVQVAAHSALAVGLLLTCTSNQPTLTADAFQTALPAPRQRCGPRCKVVTYGGTGGTDHHDAESASASASASRAPSADTDAPNVSVEGTMAAFSAAASLDSSRRGFLGQAFIPDVGAGGPAYAEHGGGSGTMADGHGNAYGMSMRSALYDELTAVSGLLVSGFYGSTVWFAPLCLRELNRLQSNFPRDPFECFEHVMIVAEAPSLQASSRRDSDGREGEGGGGEGSDGARDTGVVRQGEEGGSGKGARVRVEVNGNLGARSTEHGKDIVGFIDLDQRPPKNPASDDSPRPYISDLAVCNTRRRMGIGKALMGHAEDMCREWGHPNVYLKVERDNAPAMRLYQQCGYRVINEYMDSNKVLMAKDLTLGGTIAVAQSPANSWQQQG